MPSANDSTRLTADENTACDHCGQFGALEIAGRHLCPDCVTLAGCGCSGSESVNED